MLRKLVFSDPDIMAIALPLNFTLDPLKQSAISKLSELSELDEDSLSEGNQDQG